MKSFKIKHPWRSGLVISTVLSVLIFIATLLWQNGHPEWAFVLLFGSLWLVVSLLLINDEFNVQSGLILADVLDDNVDHLLNRIHQLEHKFLAMNQLDSAHS